MKEKWKCWKMLLIFCGIGVLLEFFVFNFILQRLQIGNDIKRI